MHQLSVRIAFADLIGSDIYQQIFDEIVFQAMQKQMVSGRLHTDSTHLKANTNKNKHIKVEALESVKFYLGELNEAVDQDRLAHGKSPFLCHPCRQKHEENSSDMSLKMDY